MNFLSFFIHINFFLLFLLIMYSCKNLIVLGLIPLSFKYLLKGFRR